MSGGMFLFAGTNNKYLHVLKSLVEAGAQRNGANHRGETPLHIATITGIIRINILGRFHGDTINFRLLNI